MKSVETIAATLLIFLSIVVMSLFAFIATKRALTEIEAILLQFFALLAGIGGSYIFGRRTSKESMREAIEPHARSAFRRLMTLYRSISHVATIIESEEPPRDDASKIDIIRAIVVEQIATADDALADWRDVVPEAVEEVRKEIRIAERGETTQ